MDVNDMPHDDQPQYLDSQDPSDSGAVHPENVEVFAGASQSFPHGSTFMDQFFSDEYSELRKENIYYPFASQQDWEITSWLLRSPLSMVAIDTFLSLKLVSAN